MFCKPSNILIVRASALPTLHNLYPAVSVSRLLHNRDFPEAAWTEFRGYAYHVAFPSR